jgi:glutaminyl-peptide cyclotransferase
MKKYNLFAIIGLSVFTISCEQSQEEINALFKIDTSNLKQAYTLNEALDLGVLNIENNTIDSVVYLMNDTKLGNFKNTEKQNITLLDKKVGYNKIVANVYFEGKKAENETSIMLYSGTAPELLEFDIVNTYPHDIAAYTQGFEFYKDTLLEGTGNGVGRSGNRGVSSIRKVNYKTGEAYKTQLLDNSIFGEGITVLNNKLYQLTYRNNEAYVYNVNTFKKEKTLPYFKKMEGWGLTNDGTYLYMSDGTEKIYKLDPETYKAIEYINVYTNSAKIESINELEWIDGKIWANIYTKDAIAVINPKNGAVEQIVNCSNLKNKTKEHIDRDYFNGIAYHKKNNTLFVTGKNWDTVFEIKVK